MDEQNPKAPLEARIGIFLRLRPTARPTGRVTADAEANWVEFSMPKDAAAGLINNSRESYRFPFDGVLPPEAAQGEVFERVALPVLRAALDGYSGTVFAYGQTGSGKTYTITGGTERYADRGLIPRALGTLFAEIRARGGTVAYTVHLSYLEIYNEVGYDLLDPGREVSALEDLPRVTVLEDEEGGMHVRNLSLHATASEEEALNLLFLGDTNRTVAETPLNQASSRSHCMFSLHIEARRPGEEVVHRSRLNFVDLAGSERVAKTGLEGATHVREARYINLSLHYLEQVIICLQDRKPHVPYRNSLLTLLLRDSLGGNCRTVMVATVAPEAAHVEESISTCRFAQRVAQISNTVTINEELDLPALVRRLKAENQLLRQQLQLMDRGTSNGAGALATRPAAMPGDSPGAGEQQVDDAGQEGCGSVAAAGVLEVRRELSEGERRRLQAQLRAYLEDPSPDAVLGLEGSMLFISNAFAMLKGMLCGTGAGTGGSPGALRRAEATRLVLMGSDAGPNKGSSDWAAALPQQGGGGEGWEVEEEAGQELRALRVALQQKQRELEVLVGVLHKQGLLPPSGLSSSSSRKASLMQQLQQRGGHSRPSSAAAATTQNSGGGRAGSVALPAITAEMLQDRNKAFKYFCAASPAHDAVQENKALLRARHEAAKTLGAQATAAKQRIAALKSRLEARRLQRCMDTLLSAPGGVGSASSTSSQQHDSMAAAAAAAQAVDKEERVLREEIEREKVAYKAAFAQLKEAKGEVEQLQAVLEHSSVRLQADFQAWWGVVSAAVAPGAGESGAAASAVSDEAADAWSIKAVSTQATAEASTPGRPGSAHAASAMPPSSRQQQQAAAVEQGQPSFAGWGGAGTTDPSFRFHRQQGNSGPALGTASRPSSSGSGMAWGAPPGSSSSWGATMPPRPQPQAAAAQPTPPASLQPQQPPQMGLAAQQPRPAAALSPPPPAAVPSGAAPAPAAADPLTGVDPEVLAAARPLLTGNAAADADIIRFYQARTELLRGF